MCSHKNLYRSAAVRSVAHLLSGLVVAGIIYGASRAIGTSILGTTNTEYPGLLRITEVFSALLGCLSFLWMHLSLTRPSLSRTTYHNCDIVLRWTIIAMVCTLALLAVVACFPIVSDKGIPNWEDVPIDSPQYVGQGLIGLIQTTPTTACVSCNPVQVDRWTINGDRKSVLFMHPHSEAFYSTAVSESTKLSFSIALAPEVWQADKGDGAQFDIYVDDGQDESHPFSEFIDPKNITADREWHDHEIDLFPWAGRTVTITFATGPGPRGDSDYDWAGWGEPYIAQPVTFDFLAELPNADRGGATKEQVRTDFLSIDDEPRAILFQHPSSQVTYRVDIPVQAGLHFGLGMDPAIWSTDLGDGVEFNIYVRRSDDHTVSDHVFQQYIDPKHNPDDRHWQNHVVDLSDYNGQTVDIVFETFPGPADDARFDWSGWSTPVLVAYDVLNVDAQVMSVMGAAEP